MATQNSEALGARFGHGRERTCYFVPGEPDKIIKISPAGKDKQTQREIEYFSWLKKKGVPFDMIPEYYGPVHIDGQLGIKQQAILDNGKPAAMMVSYLRSATDPQERSRRNAECIEMIGRIREYLVRWNIMICDLNAYNILVVRENGVLRPWLIDGLGTTDGLPLCRYIPLLGRGKINRQLDRLIARIPEL